MPQSVLNIVLKAKDEASKTIKTFSNSLEKSGIMSEKFSRNAKLAGVAVTGLGITIGTKAVQAATSFEQSMSDINTLFTDNGESIKDLEKGIKSMLKVMPKSSEDLGASAYQIVSAGITNTSEALKVLESSSKLAVAGLGSTQEATDILTSAINAFGISVKDSSKVADVFFKAVKSGKTTVSELAQGFGQVAPLANELGVSFEELIAITSAMTTSGLKASISYTQQKAVMSNLLKPTKEMQELYSKLNISNIKTTISTKGFAETIRMLASATDGNNEILAKAFGSVEGLNAVMMLVGETGKNATNIFNDMTEGVDALSEAFTKQSQTASSQFQILKNNLNVAMIELGNKILPVIIPLVKKLTDFIGNLNPSVIKWGVGLSLIIGPALLVIGFLPTLIGGITALGSAMTFLAANPIILVIAGIVAIGVAIITLIKHWEDLKALMIIAWEGIKIVFSSGINFFKSVLIGAKDWIVGIWSSIWDTVVKITTDAIDAIVAPIQKVIDFISIAVDKIKGGIGNITSGIGNFISGATGKIGSIFGLATGGIVTKPTLAMVGESGPEAVIPLNKLNRSSTGGITVNINGGNYLSEDAAEKIGDKIINVLKSNIRV